MTLSALLARVATLLGEANIPYMLTGSLASSLYGTPRATQDIDLVIEASAEQVDILCSALEGVDLYVSPAAAHEALEHGGQFNAIDPRSGWKVDFIIRKAREFSRTEFGRRRTADVLGLTVPMVSPEDLILAKLEWAKKGDSERQRRDARAIAESQGEALDGEYIRRWAGALDVLDLWTGISADSAT